MARFVLLPAPWDIDVDPERRQRRAVATGFVVSILLHVALLLIVPKRHDEEAPIQSATGPLSINIASNDQRQSATPPSPPPPPAPQKAEPEPTPKAPPVITAQRRSPQTTFSVPPSAKPSPPAPAKPTPQSPPDQAPPVDMMSQVNANRARREQAERDAKGSAPPSGGGGGSSGGGGGGADPAMAAINRNLARLNRGSSWDHSGTSGVFQLISIGYNQAEYSFRGWNEHYSQSWSETIRVDKGSNENIQIAVVRNMIEVIRKHESGDFSWDSHRLQRTVTLSARPADQSGLEDFLMKEFFSDDRRVVPEERRVSR